MSEPRAPRLTCRNGCDLAYYGTHQPGCALLPHDDTCPCDLCPTTARTVAAYMVNTRRPSPMPVGDVPPEKGEQR